MSGKFWKRTHKIARMFKGSLELRRLKETLMKRLDSNTDTEPSMDLKQAYATLQKQDYDYMLYLQVRYFLKKLHALEFTQIAESMKCMLDCRTNSEGKVRLAHLGRS